MDELKKLRSEIDEVNKKIVELLSLRIKIVKKIKDYKIKNGMKIFDLKREKEIFKYIEIEAEKKNLDKKYLKKIFKIIIKNSRKNQR